MNELERWASLSSRGLSGRDERQHNKAASKLVAQTQMQGLRVDAEAALAARTMERAVDLDNYRKALAGDDPDRNAVLTRIEIGFAEKALRLQRGFGSEFPS